MKNKLILMMMAVALVVSGCASQKKLDSGDEFSVEADSGSSAADTGGDDLSLDTPSDSQTSANDDLSLDEPTTAAKPTAGADLSDMDAALENELNSLDAEGTTQAATPNPQADELSLDEPIANPAQADNTTAPVVEEPQMAEVTPPAEVTLDAPMTETPIAQNNEVAPPNLIATSNGNPAVINAVQYTENSNGGAVTIKADQPLIFTTRFNSTTNQFVVEVQNSQIPQKLTRALNTKDMESSIGSVDIYQKDGSNIARFVVQLRPGATEPIVQQEGNSLLIIGRATNAATSMAANQSNLSDSNTFTANTPAPETMEEPSGTMESGMGSASMSSADSNANAAMVKPKTSGGILEYENLEDFLMGDQTFSGKKISIETSGMRLGDAISFLSEESGANIVIDNSVPLADTINIKLRDIPWDQAFVMILKTKKLVYKRQGNVIRVTTLADLKRDEEDAIALKNTRQAQEPVVVRRFFVAYAAIEELRTQIIEFLNATDAKKKTLAGSSQQPTTVLIDKRNSALIVTDTEANMKSIEQIIKAVDTQPKQVQIDSKIIVASENFTRSLGVDWSITGSATTPNTTVNIGSGINSGALSTTVNWGQLDMIGSLSATLRFGETKNLVKVLASPSITVLSNTAASISKTTDVAIPGSTVNTETGAVIQTRTIKAIGLQLNVTPTVTNENTVMLKINLNRSIPGGAGADSSTAQTEMFVKSGLTAVVGGIFESNNRDDVAGVPYLREVPVLGALFEGRTKTIDKNELMMFITPTILKPL